MRVTFDVTLPDALVFWTLLNDDEGARAGACAALLSQHAPPAVGDMTRFIAVLGAISGAIARQPEFEGELARLTAKRAAEIRKLVGRK